MTYQYLICYNATLYRFLRWVLILFSRRPFPRVLLLMEEVKDSESICWELELLYKL